MAFDLLSDTEIMVTVSVIEDANGPASVQRVKFSDLTVSMDVKRDLKHNGMHTSGDGVFKTIYTIVDREYDLDNSKLYVYRNETRIQTFNGWQQLYTGLFFLANWYQKDFRDLSTYTFDELILNLRRNGIVDFMTGTSTEKVTISLREIEHMKGLTGKPVFKDDIQVPKSVDCVKHCQHCGLSLDGYHDSLCSECLENEYDAGNNK